MELKELAKEWRIWILAAALIISFIMLNPHYVGQPGGDAGSIDFNAKDTIVFDDAHISAKGGDAGQAREGGSGGSVNIASPLQKTDALSTDLSGGEGGGSGLVAREGIRGMDGETTTEGSRVQISPIEILDNQSRISPQFTLTNDGSTDARGIAFIHVEEGSQAKKNIELESGESRTVTFDGLDVDQGIHEYTAGFNQQTSEGIIANDQSFADLSIIGQEYTSDSFRATLELNNLGTQDYEGELSAAVQENVLFNESVTVESGSTDTFEVEESVENLPDHFTLNATTEHTEDSISVCNPEVECGQVNVNEIQTDGGNPVFNVTVQNTGPLNLDEEVSVRAGGQETSERALVAPEEAEEFLIELEMEEEGRFDYEVSTPHDAEAGSFVNGRNPGVTPVIAEISQQTVTIELTNPGAADISDTLRFRSGSEKSALDHVHLEPNETKERQFELGDDAESVNVFVDGSSDHEIRSGGNHPVELVEDEVCGHYQEQESLFLNSSVEVCGQGATLETNNSIIIGEGAEVDVLRDGDQSPLEFHAENIRAAGSFNSDGPDAGDRITIGTNINKGLDLEGGVRVLLSIGEPEDPVEDVDANLTDDEDVDDRQLLAEDTRTKLETRMNAYGLDGATARTVRLEDDWLVQVEAPDVDEARIIEILEQEGSFEARMPLPVRDDQFFELENEYVFERTDQGIRVDGRDFQSGDRFKLDNTEFEYVRNDEDGTAQLEVLMYDGEDVLGVREGDGTVDDIGDMHEWRFPIILSDDAANNVLQVSRNYEAVQSPIPQESDTYLGLNGEILRMGLYVDGQKMNELRMGSVFRQQSVSSPSIQGSESSAEEARASMNEMQSILQSGSLQAPVSIESVSTVSSALGDEFWRASLIALGAALVAVGVIVYIRYSSLKVALPMFFTGAAEIFIITGSWFTTQGTLGLASIAGIIAAVGTGVDDQIIIADESGREKVRSWRKRMKRAFFVIFTSAASTIGAMAPIISPEISHIAIALAGLGLIGYSRTRRGGNQYLLLGIFALIVGLVMNTLNPSGFALQTVRGFAETTILGVVIGIAITRPAYAKVLEYLRHKD